MQGTYEECKRKRIQIHSPPTAQENKQNAKPRPNNPDKPPSKPKPFVFKNFKTAIKSNGGCGKRRIFVNGGSSI